MNICSLPFVLIPPVLARCGICGHVATCQTGDTEMEFYLCRQCVEFVVVADQALAAAQLKRPPEGVAFSERNH